MEFVDSDVPFFMSGVEKSGEDAQASMDLSNSSISDVTSIGRSLGNCIEHPCMKCFVLDMKGLAVMEIMPWFYICLHNHLE